MVSKRPSVENRLKSAEIQCFRRHPVFRNILCYLLCHLAVAILDHKKACDADERKSAERRSGPLTTAGRSFSPPSYRLTPQTPDLSRLKTSNITSDRLHLLPVRITERVHTPPLFRENDPMRGDLEYNDNAAQNYRPGQYHTANKIQKIRQVHRIA